MSHRVKISEKLVERLEAIYHVQIDQVGLGQLIESLCYVGMLATSDEVIDARLRAIVAGADEIPAFCPECGDLIDRFDLMGDTGLCQVCEMARYWKDEDDRDDPPAEVF